MLVTLGNVIFPLFATPYISVLLAPALWLGAMLVEGCVIYAFNSRLSAARIAALIAAANATSWIAGLLIVGSLPNGPDRPTAGGVLRYPAAGREIVKLSFVIAFVLSVAIEYGVLALLTRRSPLHRRFLSVLLANAASYLFLALFANRL